VSSPTISLGPGTTQGDPCDGPCPITSSTGGDISPTPTIPAGTSIPSNATISPSPTPIQSPTPDTSPTIRYYHFIHSSPSAATGFFTFGPDSWILGLILVAIILIYLFARRGMAE
ncbi:MAG TPA: hypothetical protein VJI13_04805, partial [Candidatus Norongarragalinales archaeon]|nr:hypothetical protein [Candidatus Norongarragalinales archaeon]